MRLKCYFLMDGPGPSEATVGISTADGEEELVVHASLIQRDGLEVGRVLETRRDGALIELPSEAASGRSRVWVAQSELASA
jgi:hypothetical protein